MLNIKLKRPLIVFDLESTGLNPRHDRIVEIAAVKVFPDGTQDKLVERLNPQRKIPREVSELHGIRDEDVVNCPKFVDVAGEISKFFRDSDLAGFSVQQFDIPLLQSEFSRVGVNFPASDCRVIDAKTIFHKKEPRDLTAAFAFYCGKEHTDAHGALPDVMATLEVLEGEINRYPDLPETVDELHEFCNPDDPDALDPKGRFRWRDKEVVLGFGKKAGLSLKEVARKDPEYLRWMIRKDFSDDVKYIAKEALEGRFPQE